MIKAPTEHQIQLAIVDVLRLAGLKVKETTAYRQKGPSGMDKGIPDLLVYCDRAPGVYIGIEVKRPRGRLTREQMLAVAFGEFQIAYSPKDALRIVRDRLVLLQTVPVESSVIAKLDSLYKGWIE